MKITLRRLSSNLVIEVGRGQTIQLHDQRIRLLCLLANAGGTLGIVLR